MCLEEKARVLSQTEPAVLVPPPGVGDPLSARRAPTVCATRSRIIAQLHSGGGEK
jgi:hypothetical protein